MVGWLNTLITYLPISHKMCLKANGNILHSGAHGKACSKRMQKERQKAALLRNIVQGHGWKCDPYRKWESNQSGIHLSCPWRSLLNIKITYMKYTINHRAVILYINIYNIMIFHYGKWDVIWNQLTKYIKNPMNSRYLIFTMLLQLSAYKIGEVSFDVHFVSSFDWHR